MGIERSAVIGLYGKSRGTKRAGTRFDREFEAGVVAASKAGHSASVLVMEDSRAGITSDEKTAI